MVSDFALQWDIIQYANEKDIYYEGLFGSLFDKAIKLKFKREERINTGESWEDKLCFIHTGAVLGEIHYNTGYEIRQLLLGQQIFYAGRDLAGKKLRKQVSWMAVRPTEITCISIQTLFKALEPHDPKGVKLIKHIEDADESASKLYNDLKRYKKLEDKITFLLKVNSEYRRIMKKYLAEIMGVSPYSLSRALAEWSAKFLV